eukprot:2936119-Rhodomonas_salina.1
MVLAAFWPFHPSLSLILDNVLLQRRHRTLHPLLFSALLLPLLLALCQGAFSRETSESETEVKFS